MNVRWIVAKGVNVNQYSSFLYNYGAKIVLSFEKTIFLFNFYDKSLEVSILFFIFATNSVSPFVWVSGLFTGKGRLRNVIFESQISQI